jgi:SNF2 family DNA or RNA helicase
MTRRKFAPHPYQGLIIDHQSELERGNTWAGMGLGKTVSSLTVLESLYHFGFETEPTLVIAPYRVAQSTWPDEVEKWDHLSGLEVVPVLGDASRRAMQLRRDAPIFTINYENLPWLIDWFKHNPRPWPFGTVIADESTKLKSTRISQQKSKKGTEFLRKGKSGVRGQALAEVAHKKVHRWVNLSGLPAPNGLKDLWGQQWFVDGGERLGRSFSAFEGRWFAKVRGEGGYAQSVPLAHAQEQIQAALTDCTIAIDPADWFDLEQPIVRSIPVELPAAARRIYRDMERKMFAEIESQPVEAVNRGVSTLKCLQLASGAVYVDEDGNWKEVHDAKLQALEDIVEEAAGMPVLVAYHFKPDLVRLQRAFPKGRVLDQDPQTIRDWNAGKIRVLFAHPESAGHGLNLQDGGNILVFFSHWWALEAYEQIIERIGPVRQLQAGHNRPVFIYHIVARNTVDEDVMERRRSKRQVHEILMDAMKRRKSP